jgi:hypothetical protein
MRNMFRAKSIWIACVFVCVIVSHLPLNLFSQTGSIKGVVKEKGTGETIIGANVVIAGTTTGSTTNLDGQYEIRGLEPGSYTIQISFISYETFTAENVMVQADEATVLNVDLGTETQLLQTVDIVARMLKEKESILLLEQKKANEIVQYIGSQELSRKGIGDVATAVTKVTGISKVEGSNDIYVRGLGDRYNSTQMNGLPMPSNNPEQKNISLDIFSTDIVEYIGIDKVYNNRIYGDFAGGNVDINSRDFTGDPFVNVELGTTVNFSALDEKRFPLKEGPDYFGLTTSSPPGTLESFDFENSLDPVYMTPVGTQFSISAGSMMKTGKDKKRELNYFATLNFGNDFSTKEGVAFGAVNSSGVPHKSFVMKTYGYSTNSTGMFNLGYRFNKNHKLNYNFVLINSTENSNEVYKGTIIDIADNDNGLMVRKIFEKNTLLINQLLGKHTIGLRSDVNWGFSYNSVVSDAPDRLQNTFRMVDGDYYFGQNQITDNHRYFHYLTENEIAGNLAMSYKFLSESDLEYRVKLTLGATGRHKTREFQATQYNFRIASDQRLTIVDPDNLSAFFNQDNLENGFFRIETFRGNFQVPNALDPQVYGGNQTIGGVYLTTEYRPANRLTLLIGMRGEYVFQEVTWNTQLDPSDRSDYLEIFDLLPSLTAKYELNKKQNLRLGASKTYTLPQFKERALFIYEEVTQVKLGNPDLYQSENYNADIKWELFPAAGEIFSLGVFGKYIMNPINEFAITSATNDISFLNTGDWGYVAGAEFEIRKELIAKEKSKLHAGFNVSYMYTEQELNSEKVQEETIYQVNFTHEKARFTGASDWLVNADITGVQTLKNENHDIMATISYSYFSDRIYAIGTNNRGNIIEEPFHSLDLIVKAKFDRLSVGLTFKNLLNPAIERYQANKDSDVLVISYKKGIFSGLKIGYRF